MEGAVAKSTPILCTIYASVSEGYAGAPLLASRRSARGWQCRDYRTTDRNAELIVIYIPAGVHLSLIISAVIQCAIWRLSSLRMSLMDRRVRYPDHPRPSGSGGLCSIRVIRKTASEVLRLRPVQRAPPPPPRPTWTAADSTLTMVGPFAAVGRKEKPTATESVPGRRDRAPTPVHGTTVLKCREFTRGPGI